MNTVLTLMQICGSLGLFLYGMQILSDGLQKSAGSKQRSVLGFMTGNRFMAVLTGLLVTLVIQSSSATTVMVVSFVNAGLMSFVQSIGVIIGANIGTTVTGWIVALVGFSMDITVISLFSIAFAVPMMFSKKVKARELSGIFLGFGLLFLGLNFLQSSMPDISEHTAVLEFLSRFNNDSMGSILLCVLIGTVLTMIVQSSSATMAITITMAYQGWIGPWTAAALCLGQNIGTTVTAYIASIGTSTNAKRSAAAHILFNVIGTVLSVIFFRPLLSLVNALTVGDIFSMEGEALNMALPAFLAGFHTLFNLLNAMLFFPFIRQFAKLVERMVPEREAADEGTYRFRYIASGRVDAPEIYLLAVREEMMKMMDLAGDMFTGYMELSSGDAEDIEEQVVKLRKEEDLADQMQEQLIDFAVSMEEDSQTPTNAHALNSMIRSIDEIESVTDSIFNLTKLMEDGLRKDISLTDDARKAVRGYQELAMEFLSFVRDNLMEGSYEALMKAEAYEERMDSEHRRISELTHLAIQGGGREQVRGELMVLEMIRNLEHIGDYLQNIAEASFSAEK